MTDLSNQDASGSDDNPQLVAQRDHFMQTLPSVLKDLWPKGAEFDLSVYGEAGEIVMMMGASLPEKGIWG
jgi:hypothetical protein